MAIHSTIDTINKAATKHELPYWRVTSGTSLLDENDSEGDTATSMQLLNECLEGLEGSGYVTVTLSPVNREEKGSRPQRANRNLVYSYKIGGTDAKISGVGSTAAPTFGNSFMMDLFRQNIELQTQLAKINSDWREKDLLRRIDELEKGDKPDPMINAALTALSGMFGPGAQQAHAPAMAGSEPPTPAPGADSSEEFEKFKAATRRLWKVDPQLGSHLLLIADFAEKDPDKYFQFVPMLKMM